MKIYLLRHADANFGGPDSARAVSAKGVKQVKALATHLARIKLKLPRQISHSSLRRTRETGELLLRDLGGGHILREKEGLCPGDPVGPLVDQLQSRMEDEFWIGHNPLFESLVSTLLSGEPEVGMVSFGKAHLLCLERKTIQHPTPGGVPRWTIRGYLTPRLCVPKAGSGK